MAIDAFAKPFLSLPMFRGLKPLQITEIVRRADRIVYRPGGTIIEEDQVGDAAILIVSGEAVRVRDDQPGALTEPIPEGSLLGELAMLVETVHSTTVLARSTVRALRISREDMHELMAEDSSLAQHFTACLTQRLSRIAEELAEIDSRLAEMASPDSAGLVSAAQRQQPSVTTSMIH
jgi:CRP-like cAMP-binding protein